MTWIRAYEEDRADPRTKRLFQRVAGPGGQVDNILRLHALRPHTLTGHMALYKSVLHHTSNRLSAEFLESLGVLASRLNSCDYCEHHHAAGLRRAVGDDARADGILGRVAQLAEEFTPGGGDGRPGPSTGVDRLEPGWEAALHYAAKLTRTPEAMTEADVEALREAGLDDGEILEVNQVVAYFAYANRTVQGLGGTTEGEQLGYHPSRSSDPEEWDHR